MPFSGTTFGPRSRSRAGRRSCQTLGCSMMWSSTETTLASAGSIGSLSGEDGVVGKLDPHPQQRQAMNLSLGVAAETLCDTTAEGAVEHELEGEHVGDEVPLDGTGDQRAEVGSDPLGGDLLHERVVCGSVVGEE